MPVQVWRKGATKDLTVTVAEMADDDTSVQRGKRRGKQSEPGAVNRLGLVVSGLSADKKKQLGIDSGVVVEDVRDGHLELRPGDIILTFIYKGTKTDIKSVEQFDNLLSKLDKTATFSLQVRRGDNQTYITIKGFGDNSK